MDAVLQDKLQEQDFRLSTWEQGAPIAMPSPT